MKFLLPIALLLFVSCGRQPEQSIDLSAGVSKQLATYRKGQVSDVEYDLSFSIPEARTDSIPARLLLKLSIADLSQPLVLDFKSNRKVPQSATVNETEVAISYQKEHLIIPTENLRQGDNTVEIDFLAGEMSLNRNTDYLFTLLVPDRARTLFPCIDQPDIKASYKLSVTAPREWEVVAGAPLLNRKEQGDFVTFQFAASDQMSSYLFSFVAGDFEVAGSDDSDFNMQFYHQEKDTVKVALSVPEIFSLHREAVDFLETYTDRSFPFQKLDYAAIFSHPYGGMEHTGAIQYRQSALFLDSSATQRNELGRAKLIAHETAHMWFGNLVTMKWFDDVWLKEVFANFMADKIVNPAFTDINHELAFFTSHYPSAYNVDRTRGANPIRQNLDNLNNAGSLYGGIIYHKAPIMMRQLETIVGENNFREGIRNYIRKYANDNAEWNDLISILDEKTPEDLRAWSQVWVNSAGRPVITGSIQYDEKDKIKSFTIEQQAEDQSDKVWPQLFGLSLIYPDSVHVLNVSLKQQKVRLEQAIGLAQPEAIVYNSDGLGYGVFPVSDAALATAPTITDDIARAAVYLNGYENALMGNIAIAKALEVFMNGLSQENNELILSLLSEQATHLFWHYLPEESRARQQESISELLLARLQSDEPAGIKKTLFNTFLSVAYTGTARDKLYAIWSQELSIQNLNLNQDDLSRVAMQLALYGHPHADDVLKEARAALNDPNKIERFDFLYPALSPDSEVRNNFFKSFADAEKREKESWVQTACYFMHHPLRQETAIATLGLSLQLIEEIQQSGDIFFPKAWLDNTIGMYTSEEAYAILNEFLENKPALNPQLKAKILQATHDLFTIQERSKLEKSNM